MEIATPLRDSRTRRSFVGLCPTYLILQFFGTHSMPYEL